MMSDLFCNPEDKEINIIKTYACLDETEMVNSTEEVAFKIKEAEQYDYFNGIAIDISIGYKIVKTKGGCVIMPKKQRERKIYSDLGGV